MTDTANDALAKVPPMSNDAPPSALLRTYADRLSRVAAALGTVADQLLLLADEVDATERLKVAKP
jgi:hypothetical protein